MSSEIQASNLSEACRIRGASLGDRVAFRSGEEALTFAEMDRRADRTAAALRDSGVGPGDRVALVAKDALAGYEILFGAARIGAVLTPVNWRLSPVETAFILADAGVRLAFVDAASAERLKAEPLGEGVRTIVLGDEFRSWRDAPRGPLRETPSDVEDAVVQIYTSGTSGHPKGVVLANRTFFRLLQGMRERGDLWMGLGGDDRLLLSLPEFHIGGLWWAVQGFLAGATGVLMESFQPAEAIRSIERWRITKVPLVPAMMQFVLAEPIAAEADLSSVTGVLYGGSPIAPSLLERAMDLFRCDFFQIYGLTETGNMAVCLRPSDHERDRGRLLAAGRPLPGVEVRVVGPDGDPLPVGEVGEIWLKSPSTMLGYWNDEAATRETLVDGWLRTGDAGLVDEEGYVHVSDRVKDMIIYAGENVFPAEVEAALCRHPSVAEAAVVGAPDDRWGEMVRAYVVPREGGPPKVRELTQFLRGILADFKVPRSFEFVASLPRNPSGKLLRRKLRDPLWEGRPRSVN